MKEKDENRCKTRQQIDLQIEQISRIKPRNHHQPIMQQLLMKSKLKHIQRQYLFNITRKIDENWNKKECRKSKNEQIREMTIKSGRYEQSAGNTDLKSSLSYINNTDSKLIDNYKLKIYHTSTNKSNKNNCSSFLDKCRVATEHYDVLKNQVICKIKLKKHQKYLSQSGNLQNIQYHDKDKDKDKIQEQLAIRMGKQNDEELRRKERERRANRNRNRNRMNGRYWSQSNSDRHDQRYVNMSVAEFMEQKQQNISARMKQRFDQYRKQKILSQIQTEYQKPQLSRTLYPLITCRVQSRLNMMHN